MADYAPNFTNRYRLAYTTKGRPHKITFRCSNTPGPLLPAVITDVENFLNALQPMRLTDWTLTGAEYSEAGTNFFLPSTLPTIDGGGAAVAAKGLQALNINFQGRSTLGNRCSLYVYGVNVDPIEVGTDRPSEDYRLMPAESADVTAALAAMAAWTAITAIDGSSQFWNQYANVNVNSHWQRKSRGS